MKFENLQQVLEYRQALFGELDALETVAHAAQVHESKLVRSHLIDLLAYGKTAVYCGNPSTPTELCTQDVRDAREVSAFLRKLGLEREYTNRDEFTFRLEREG